MIKVEDKLKVIKNNLEVLLLGSYSTECFYKLQILKQELQNCKYQKTTLVSDLKDTPELEKLQFKNEDLFVYKKSISAINNSKINLFIFFKNCPLGSVISEMIVSVLKFQNYTCATFFFEDGLRFDSVPKGFMSEYNLNIRKFSDMEDLARKAKQECQIHITENKCHM